MKKLMIVAIVSVFTLGVYAQETLNPPVIQSTPETQNPPAPLPEKPAPTATTDSKEMLQPTPITPPPTTKRNHEIFSFYVAPEYITNSSESDYSNRDYETESPAYGLGLAFWFHENWGAHINYSTSEMASVEDTTSSRQEAKHERMTYGFSYRVFWDKDPFSSYFKFSLQYDDYSFNVKSSATTRNDLETKGILLNFEGGIPAGERGSVVVGAVLAPNLDHSESSNTYTGRSGSSPDAFGIGIGLAYKYKVAKFSSLRVAYKYYEEINQFSGATTGGSSFTNVQVKNKFKTLQIGYSLGF